jgi:hypothetical protein
MEQQDDRDPIEEKMVDQAAPQGPPGAGVRSLLRASYRAVKPGAEAVM